MKFSLVRRPGSQLWHLERADGHTVCGLVVDDELVRATSMRTSRFKCCKICIRMKDASSVILARTA